LIVTIGVAAAGMDIGWKGGINIPVPAAMQRHLAKLPSVTNIKPSVLSRRAQFEFCGLHAGNLTLLEVKLPAPTASCEAAFPLIGLSPFNWIGGAIPFAAPPDWLRQDGWPARPVDNPSLDRARSL